MEANELGERILRWSFNEAAAEIAADVPDIKAM